MRRSFRRGFGDAVAVAAALGAGAAIGAVNAISVVALRILPLLATLAVMNIAAGLELVVTQNTVIPADTSFLSFLSSNGVGGVPILAFVLMAVAAVLIVAVQYTPAGLRLYAVGEFPEAARAAGLRVNRLVAGSYVASGLCGGIAAILSVAYLSGSTTGSGDMLLSVVVTALLGVVFSRRLVPTIGGTLLSTLFRGLADQRLSAPRGLELLGQRRPGRLDPFGRGGDLSPSSSRQSVVTVQPIAENGRSNIADWLVRYSALFALIAVLIVFSASIPAFPTPQNLTSVLVNNFALLAIVSIGMTLVVAVGGIDLSVGTAVDFSSLAFVFLVLGGHAVWLSALAGLASGLAVGLFNAFLIARLGITPFLATLGHALHRPQRPTASDRRRQPGLSSVLGRSAILCFSWTRRGFRRASRACRRRRARALRSQILLKRTRLGRIILATGVHRSVAWYSGLPTSSVSGFVYALSALVCAVAGLILSATVNVYVPYSGNAFLLNAIGATFIGTTLDRNGRPNVAGTLIGVLLLAVVANGLLLSGLNFYWQQVGTGVLIFLVLAASFGKGARTSE